MAVHVLKTLPCYFAAIERGEKLFEVRRNDRFFQLGDQVDLVEWDGFAFITGSGKSSYPDTANRQRFLVGPNCTCDLCDARNRQESLRRTLDKDTKAVCWSCSCGWIGCYTRAEIRKYGAPSECSKCYRERLSECDPAGVRALISKGS